MIIDKLKKRMFCQKTVIFIVNLFISVVGLGFVFSGGIMIFSGLMLLANMILSESAFIEFAGNINLQKVSVGFKYSSIVFVSCLISVFLCCQLYRYMETTCATGDELKEDK